MATVNQLKVVNALQGDGARSTKFDVQLVLGDAGIEGVFNALIETASFPGITLNPVEFKYRGRQIPIRGNVQYDNTWSCTMYLQEDHSIKRFLESWMHTASSDSMSASVPAQDSSNVYRDLTIFQKDFNDVTSTVQYNLRYCYPKTVSALELDYGQLGTILKLRVDFSYQYYETENVNSPGARSKLDQWLDNQRSKVNAIIKGAQDMAIGKINEVTSDIQSKAKTAASGAIGKLLESAKKTPLGSSLGKMLPGQQGGTGGDSTAPAGSKVAEMDNTLE